jgi:hypothetical protein
MAGIHSFIYGIGGGTAVRKITVSQEAGATVTILNPPHGSAAAPVPTIVRMTAHHCRRPSGCLTSTKQLKSRLISMDVLI